MKKRTKLIRIFKQFDNQTKSWVWMREYVYPDGTRRVRRSPHQDQAFL